MPIVEDSILISAPRESLFPLSQDYAVRLAWDPFLRDMRFLDGSKEAGVGVRVWVRAWTGLTMEARLTGYRPPAAVAMKMLRGPWFFRRFAGTWLFEPHVDGGTQVTFRYSFESRWRWLRPLLDPVIRRSFRRDIRARLRGLKQAAEHGGLLKGPHA